MNKIKVLFISSLLLLSTQSIIANDKDFGLLKITKKVVKKFILVPAILITAGADAVEEYQDGGDTADVIEAGMLGGGTRLKESVEETVKDLGKIKDVAIDEYKKHD